HADAHSLIVTLTNTPYLVLGRRRDPFVRISACLGISHAEGQTLFVTRTNARYLGINRVLFHVQLSFSRGVIIQQLRGSKNRRGPGRRRRRLPPACDVAVEDRLMVRSERFLDFVAMARYQIDAKPLGVVEEVAPSVTITLRELGDQLPEASLYRGEGALLIALLERDLGAKRPL